MAISAILLAGAAALVVFLIFTYVTSGPKPPKGTKLPPGPPGKPFIGNLDAIPPLHSWFKFKEWGDTYGPLYRLNIAGREHYIVSSEKVANDLLRDRGNIYSSREQLPAAAKLLSDDLRPLFWPYNDTQRQGRKLMHQLCKTSAAESYQPTQILESTRLLYDLIRKPEQYDGLFERYSSGLIFRLGFGKVMKELNDPLLRRLFTELHHVERAASPGQYLVDTFPVLMHLPDWLAPFKRELKALHLEELDIMRGLLNDVKRELEQGKAPDCWEKMYIEQKDQYGLTEDQGAYVIGTLFEAGAGTTAAAMMSWCLAMVHHPNEMMKLQEEIDKAVGGERMPEFDDIPQLPRVRAVVKETLRWRPVTAGGLPHLCTKDDIYDGIYIPAGTNIHPNQWAIHRDPALYPDPDTFQPDRWLDPSYATFREPLTEHPNIKSFSAFGFGRRICPGMNIAERSLNILVARIAWACDISKKKGDNGKDIEVPLYDYCDGFNVQPNWFAFDLKARSVEKLKIVEQEFEREMESDPLKARRNDT